LRYDTDTTAPSIGDTTFHFEVVANPNAAAAANRNNTQGTTFDTGVVPTSGAFYRLDIQCTAAGVVTMSLNGSTPQTFNIPAITVGGTGSSSTGQLNNNLVAMSPPSFAGSSDNQLLCAGSKVAISGITTAAYTFLNGSTVVLYDSTGTTYKFPFTHANQGFATINDAKYVGFPAVTPIFSFGNDTQAAPTNAIAGFLIDYFSLMWNPGVGGGTGTPDKTKARYF